MKFSWQKIKKPVFILGPMADITTLPLMRICKHFGADIVFTSMVSSHAIVHDNKKTFKIIEFSEKERPVIVQLCGSNREDMVKAISQSEYNAY